MGECCPHYSVGPLWNGTIGCWACGKSWQVTRDEYELVEKRERLLSSIFGDRVPWNEREVGTKSILSPFCPVPTHHGALSDTHSTSVSDSK